MRSSPANAVPTSCAATGVRGSVAVTIVVAAAVASLAATFVVPPAARAQAGSPEEVQLAQILALADSLRIEKRYEEAEAVLVERLSSVANETDRVSVLTRLGRVRTLAWKLPEAETTLLEAVQLAETVGDSVVLSEALYALAMAIDDQGRPARVIPIYERIIAVAERCDDPAVDGYGARAHLGLARRHLRAGEFDLARSHFDPAIATFRARGNREWEYRSKFLLGILQARTADHEAARATWRETLEWSRANGLDVIAGGCLNNLGRLEIYHGDPSRAVAYWREAYELQMSAGHIRSAMSPGMNAAIALRESGRYDESGAYLEELLAQAREHAFHDQEISALVNLGEVARSLLRFDRACAYYRQALAMLEESDDPERELNARVGLAIAMAENDSLEASIVVLERASSGLRERIEAKSRCTLDWRLGDHLVQAGRYEQGLAHLDHSLVTAEQFGLMRFSQEILVVAAQAHRALGRPDSALVCLRQATAAWEDDRSIARDPTWREIHGGRGSRICTDLADLLLDYPPDVPYADRARDAFDTMQRFKARTLLERIVDPRGSATDTLSNLPEPVELAELQRAIIRPGELLLESFVGPERSFLFAVTPTEFRVVRLPGFESEFFVSVERYRRLLARSPGDVLSSADREVVCTAGRSMATKLLSEVADLVAGCERILYVPDGPLHVLSLGSLVLEDEASPEAPLLARHQVVRVPSCALLAWQRRGDEAKGAAPRNRPLPDHRGDGRVLALAERRGSGDQELAGTVDEVESLGRNYRRVDVCIHGDGSDAAVPLADLAQYQVLHFAAHTEVDDQRPWHSGVCLGSEDADVLRASRIATMHLDARLAVLSGCESGGGRVMSGEGVLGLSSAFLCAGVPAVVATVWPVSDEITTQLMDGFYQHLAGGETAAAALRAAQLDLHAKPATSHPFYWAGFVVVGDGDVRVDLQRRTPWLRRGLPLALVLALVLATGLALVRRRHRAR